MPLFLGHVAREKVLCDDVADFERVVFLRHLLSPDGATLLTRRYISPACLIEGEKGGEPYFLIILITQTNYKGYFWSLCKRRWAVSGTRYST